MLFSEGCIKKVVACIIQWSERKFNSEKENRGPICMFSLLDVTKHMRETTSSSFAHFVARVWERKPSKLCIIKLVLARQHKENRGKELLNPVFS